MLESIASDDGSLCVDFFEDPAGGYGFEHFRSDPEDAGRWSSVGGLSNARFDSPAEAAIAAPVSVSWLRRGAAATAWQNWCALLREDS